MFTELPNNSLLNLHDIIVIHTCDLLDKHNYSLNVHTTFGRVDYDCKDEIEVLKYYNLILHDCDKARVRLIDFNGKKVNLRHVKKVCTIVSECTFIIDLVLDGSHMYEEFKDLVTLGLRKKELDEILIGG